MQPEVSAACASSAARRLSASGSAATRPAATTASATAKAWARKRIARRCRWLHEPRTRRAGARPARRRSRDRADRPRSSRRAPRSATRTPCTRTRRSASPTECRQVPGCTATCLYALVMEQAVILFDSRCGFCRRSLEVPRLGPARAAPARALQDPEADELLGGMGEVREMASWHLVTADGRVYSAGAAFPPLLRLLPGGRSWPRCGSLRPDGARLRVGRRTRGPRRQPSLDGGID